MRLLCLLSGERLIGLGQEPCNGEGMPEKRDYYEVLGIDKAATDLDIKKAFRSLARKFHPDKNPDEPEAEMKFKELQEAYTILSNPEERRKYDMFGHDRPGGSPFGPRGFQGVNINFDDLFGGGFESIFSQFFGDSASSSSRGSDLRTPGPNTPLCFRPARCVPCPPRTPRLGIRTPGLSSTKSTSPL